MSGEQVPLDDGEGVEVGGEDGGGDQGDQDAEDAEDHHHHLLHHQHAKTLCHRLGRRCILKKEKRKKHDFT